MTEPESIEFREQVRASKPGSDARSLPVRIGIVAGSAILVVVGAAAAMGASPSPSVTPDPADLPAAVAPEPGPPDIAPFGGRFRDGGFGIGRFHDISITSIAGSNLSLATDDGWTRTISVPSSAAITRAGQTISLGDLAVGDQIVLNQTKETDGTYTITAIRVVLPILGGEVTAISGNTITVTGRDGTTGTIHVDGDTTYRLNGTSDKALSDITIGSFIVAEGTERSDGSLDADAIHGGVGGRRDGMGGGPGFRDRHNGPDAPDATPSADPATAS